MSEITLTAKKRDKSTKGKLHQLRREGKVPGVYYARGNEPILFYVSNIDLKPLIYTSETHIVNLKLDDEKSLQCIIKDTQFDPVSEKVLHIDFQGVTLGEELELQVPVVFFGQAKGIKEGGLLQQYLHKLTIGCLPRNIPEKIEVDITDLELGNSIYVKDISFENIRILNSEEAIVVSVLVPKVSEEEAETVAGEKAEEPEVISKGKSDKEE